ncbi:MoaD/ThiS family protein [Candidatus Neomarinimicrobiota bacterium]
MARGLNSMSVVGQIEIKVVLFSHFKYVLGKSEIVLALNPGATTDDLTDHLADLLPPELQKIPYRIAVNQTYQPTTVLLNDGDEVALLPPMQGG